MGLKHFILIISNDGQIIHIKHDLDGGRQIRSNFLEDGSENFSAKKRRQTPTLRKTYKQFKINEKSNYIKSNYQTSCNLGDLGLIVILCRVVDDGEDVIFFIQIDLLNEVPTFLHLL